jgi:hypothetical protein
VELIKLADSSMPLVTYPAVDGYGFYIGGDTPIVWNAAEIAELKRHVRYPLPIYVRSNPSSVWMNTDAGNLIAACDAIGLPKGKLVALDLESAVDAQYVSYMDAQVTEAGWKLVIYGQLSTVVGNPKPSGGYWVGNWDGKADDPSWTGKQYKDVGPYDLSMFDPTNLWDLKPAVPATSEDDEEMPNNLRQSQQSNNGVAVIGFAANTDTTLEFGADPKYLSQKPTFTAALLMNGKTPYVLTGADPVVLDETGTYVLHIPADLVPYARFMTVECSNSSVPFAAYVQ